MSGSIEIGGETVDAALVDVLISALAKLGEVGFPDDASRIAAVAYVNLRRRDPEQAQRINVLMHRLVSRPRR